MVRASRPAKKGGMRAAKATDGEAGGEDGEDGEDGNARRAAAEVLRLRYAAISTRSRESAADDSSTYLRHVRGDVPEEKHACNAQGSAALTGGALRRKMRLRNTKVDLSGPVGGGKGEARRTSVIVFA